MLTIEYLRTILAAEHDGLAAVTDPDTQVIDSPDILEGLTELAQRKALPFAVLFEDAFHYEDDNSYDVPQTQYSQAIYVMRMTDGQAQRSPEEDACFADCKRIRAILLAHCHDDQVSGWDRRARRDFVSGAANYVGWKLTVTFTDTESWVLTPLPVDKPTETPTETPTESAE